MKKGSFKCPICSNSVDIIKEFGDPMPENARVVHSNADYIHAEIHGFTIVKHLKPEEEIVLIEN